MRPVILLSALILLSCDAPSGPQGFIVQPADSGIGADSLGKDSAAKVDALADAAPEVDAKPRADVGETGGTRLKRRWIVADDGTREAAGLFDSELGVRCSFGVAADGELRCLPTSDDLRVLPLPTSANDPGVFYLDAECTDAVIEDVRAANRNGCQPTIGLRVQLAGDSGLFEPWACGQRQAAWPRHFRISGPVPVASGADVYALAGLGAGKCVPADANPDRAASGLSKYYRVDAEMDAGAFVRGVVAGGE